MSQIKAYHLADLLFPSAMLALNAFLFFTDSSFLFYCVATPGLTLHVVKFLWSVHKVLATLEHYQSSKTKVELFHVFIIPSYKESVQMLEETLLKLADHPSCKNYFVCFAVEKKEEKIPSSFFALFFS